MSNCTIRLPEEIVRASFIKREKRFIIRAEQDGHSIDIHTNNSGSMLGLLRPVRTIVASRSDNPRRKLPYTLELVKHDDFWVGVNTLVPNRMLKAAWENRAIPELKGFTEFKAEARVGRSRLDACLQGPDGIMWVEAKNVTLVEDERACFPDAVSARASKHMQELASLAGQGHKIACFYLVQRPDCRCFGPADFIDPVFAAEMKKAFNRGLEVLAYSTVIDEKGISLGPRLPLSWK